MLKSFVCGTPLWFQTLGNYSLEPRFCITALIGPARQNLEWKAWVTLTASTTQTQQIVLIGQKGQTLQNCA